MEKIKLGDVCKVQGGYAFKSKEFQKDNIPIIRIGNIKDNEVEIDYNVCYTEEFLNKHPEFEIKYGDILMAMSGATVGKVGKYQNYSKALLNQRVGKFIVTEKLEKRYLYFLLRSSLFEKYILNNSFGCAQPNISGKKVEEFEFYNYDNTEQIEIANKLDIIQEVIDIRKKQIEELDKLIKSQFVEMFGDRYTNNHKWKCKILKEVAQFRNGKAHEQVVDENGQYVLITSKAISTNMESYRRTNKILIPLKENDIVMVMSDLPNGKALAKCWLIEEDDKYTLNQRICVFDDYSFNPTFFYYELDRNEYFLNFDDGNGQTNLRKEDILKCPIIVPPIELQNQFAEIVQQINKKKIELQKNLEEMKKLQESLMNKYFG